MLQLQKYSLKLKYKKGMEMFLPDTLSQEFLLKVHSSEFAQTLEEIDHMSMLSLPSSHLQKIKQASAEKLSWTCLHSIVYRIL